MLFGFVRTYPSHVLDLTGSNARGGWAVRRRGAAGLGTLAGLFLGFAGAAGFVGPAPLAAQQVPTCDAPEHRQFDFWVGEWNVTTPQGQTAGKNAIRSILKGCALHESWEGASGSNGFSHNIYDRTRGVWHQTWVSDTGLLLQLEGGLVDGKMVMEGETTGPGGTVRQRITWSVEEDSGDTVRQLWESSGDGGETWSVAFDGIYTRVGSD